MNPEELEHYKEYISDVMSELTYILNQFEFIRREELVYYAKRDLERANRYFEQIITIAHNIFEEAQ